MNDNNPVEELLHAISGMDDKIVRDTLAYLLKVYVIDRGLSYQGMAHVQTNSLDTHKASIGFVELIRDLKNRYSAEMEELRYFSIEGENVFVTIDGNRHMITRNEPAQHSSTKAETKKSELSGKNKVDDKGMSSSGRFEKLEMD